MNQQVGLETSETSLKQKRKFKKQWLKETIFKKWIRESSNSDYKAHCAFCNCDLNATHSSLIKHWNSDKHKKNRPKPKPRETKPASLMNISPKKQIIKSNKIQVCLSFSST